MSKVTAIIVTHNGLVWLDRCIGGLYGAEGVDRIVVVDNASTDGTPVAVTQRYPRVELIGQDRNLGFGAANNIGLRRGLEAGSSHILLLNQDAWLGPGTLAHLIDASVREPHFGVVSPLHLNGMGDALDLNFSTYIGAESCPGLVSDLCLSTLRSQLYPVRFVNAAAWLIGRSCLQDVGGFDPHFFHYGEDDNYLHRLRFHGFEVGIDPMVHVRHDRQGRSSAPERRDPLERYRLDLMLRLSDPGKTASEAHERRSLRGELWAGIIRGDRKAMQWAWQRRRVLRDLDAEALARTRALTRERGPSFL